MTLEILQTITPFITLFLMVGMGVIGWLIKKLIEENKHHFEDLKKELKQRIDKVENDVEHIEKSRILDQKNLYENFVLKEWFFETVGKTENSIGKIFKYINQLNQTVTRHVLP